MQTITLDLHSILYPNPYTLSASDPLRHGAYPRLLATVMPPFLIALLEQTNYNKAHAARLAGFDRSTLEVKLQHYGVVLHTQAIQTTTQQVKS